MPGAATLRTFFDGLRTARTREGGATGESPRRSWPRARGSGEPTSREKISVPPPALAGSFFLAGLRAVSQGVPRCFAQMAKGAPFTRGNFMVW